MKVEELVIGQMYKLDRYGYAIPMQIVNNMWYGLRINEDLTKVDLIFRRDRDGRSAINFSRPATFAEISNEFPPFTLPKKIDGLMSKFGCNESHTRQLVSAILEHIKEETDAKTK